MNRIFCWLLGCHGIEHRSRSIIHCFCDHGSRCTVCGGGRIYTVEHRWMECVRCGEKLTDTSTRTTLGVEQ